MNVLRFSDLCAQGKAAGQRVFIRADLNVPQDDSGAITEDTRIRASVPCVQMALDAGAAVMVTSHLGRPKEGEFKPEDSLAPVARRLGELLGREVPLVSDWVDGVDVKPGQFVLMGKPVGTMGSRTIGRTVATSAGAQRPTLYIEMRQKNVPIDPTGWWAASTNPSETG